MNKAVPKPYAAGSNEYGSNGKTRLRNLNPLQQRQPFIPISLPDRRIPPIEQVGVK